MNKKYRQTKKDDTDLLTINKLMRENTNRIQKKINKRKFNQDKYRNMLSHLNFKELNFIRMDTIEALIKKESFISSIFDNMIDKKIDDVYFRVAKNQGLYITLNQAYQYENVFNLFMFILSQYLNYMELTPIKYKESKKPISEAFIESVRSKFKCKYQTDINRNIIITKLHLFTAGHDEKYFNKLKRDSKYKNHTTNKQGKKEYYQDTIYSKETQQTIRNISKECIYCYDKDNKIYKHEYRLGVYEVSKEFKGMKFTDMFDINKILEHLKTEKQNGNQNKGIVMKLKENDVRKELYKAIDIQKELSKEIKDEIKRQIDKRLRPIYKMLYEHEKRITALEVKANNVDNGLLLSNADNKYYKTGLFYT